MFYSLAADALLIVHLLFILFVVLGALLVMKWRWLIYLHLPTVFWGILIEFNHWICPLTPWENSLRQTAGEASYNSGFIEHYLLPLIYPAKLNYDIQILLGSLVIIVNLSLYLLLALKIKRGS
ncbi:MAG: DUF2784 domain-containing protein [Sulfuriflexus sp.]|nr:DUF2784 domain-containing protein [Sulfuriflexus sp.]